MKTLKEARYYSNNLLDQMDAGIIEPWRLAEMLIEHMSDFEVQEFMERNELMSPAEFEEWDVA